ncbi:hypothetical protein KIPB_012311, partial [Kipferlia bialata]
ISQQLGVKRRQAREHYHVLQQHTVKDVKRGQWSGAEIDLLCQGVEMCGHSWNRVAAYVRTRTTNQCKMKFHYIASQRKQLGGDPTKIGTSGYTGGYAADRERRDPLEVGNKCTVPPSSVLEPSAGAGIQAILDSVKTVDSDASTPPASEGVLSALMKGAHLAGDLDLSNLTFLDAKPTKPILLHTVQCFLHFRAMLHIGL